MLARLGNVVYWAACIFAALWIVPVGMVIASPGSDALLWCGVYAAASALSWALGRAARYVLAGT